MAQPNNDHLAVLIDADNVSPSRVAAVIAEIARHGVATVKRVYGDWTTGQLRGWKEAASEHVIQPIQQFANTKGKNSTDSALIIDAMDLLYTGRFQGFCIVSSDSDFTRLASRIREQGVQVFGFGERKTPDSFRNACDQFTYLDVLESPAVASVAAATAVAGSDAGVGSSDSRPPERVPAAALKRDAKLVAVLRASVDAAADDEGWASLSAVGSAARKQMPDFDSRNWGYAKLSDLVRAIGLFTVESVSGAIRLRDKRG